MPSKIPFTDIGVRALKVPSTGQITVWDSKSPLGIRMTHKGSKSYVVMIGSGKRHTIGRTDIISLAEARDEARRLLAEKTLGLFNKPSAVTFETALSLFLKEHYQGKRERTRKEAARLLNRHFLPPFRRLSLSELTDAEIGKKLDSLQKTPSERLHAFRALRTMLKWCTRPPRRYIPHSPLEGYQPPGQDKKGTRVLSDQELAALWKAGEGMFGDMIRLLILWGTRNGETGRLKRTWHEGQTLTIPGTITKNKRAHTIPILPMAADILARQKHNQPHFFPGRELYSHFADGSWGKLKRELDDASGVKGWKLRDLRRTFRSNMAKLGVPREVAENLLNHVTGAGKNDLDEIYNRYDFLKEKREALARWEAYLSQLLARQ